MDRLLISLSVNANSCGETGSTWEETRRAASLARRVRFLRVGLNRRRFSPTRAEVGVPKTPIKLPPPSGSKGDEKR